MLTEERRRRSHRRRRAGEVERRSHLCRRAEDRVAQLDGRAGGPRRRERRGDVVDRAGGHLRLVERAQPLVGRPLREPRGERRDQLRPVGDPVAVRGIARIVGEGRQPERPAEPGPLPLAADRDGDRPVGGLERLVRDDVRVGVAEATRRRPADERVLGLVHEGGEGRAEQVEVDALAGGSGRASADAVRRRRRALTGDQRREDRDRPVQPGQDVADRDADLRRPGTRRAVGRPGDRHQPGFGLDHEVVAGPAGIGRGRPVAGDREMDEARVQRLERRVAEPQPVETARPEVLDEHVAAGDQAAEDLPAGVRREVEPDRALVPVDRQGVGRGARPVRLGPDPGRPPATRRVAIGRLDLDHVGTEVGRGASSRTVRRGPSSSRRRGGPPAVRARRTSSCADGRQARGRERRAASGVPRPGAGNAMIRA